MKNLLKNITPAFIKEWYWRSKSPVGQAGSGWWGDYADWNEVQKQCTGYDEAGIFEKVKQATLKVKRGEAAFERDSVTFDKLEYDQKLLDVLKMILKEYGELNVMDFGGALGSVYFQYRSLLGKDAKIKWNVIEQKHFVEFGKRELRSKELDFYYAPEECFSENEVLVILLSSVLSYLEKPYELLSQIIAYKAPYIIIDRNLFLKDTDRLTLQRVLESIYKASYPCWILSEKKLRKAMDAGYNVSGELNPFSGAQIDLGDKKAYFKGLIFKLKSAD